MKLSDGYIITPDNISEKSFICWGELNSKSYVTKGYRIEFPNVDNASNTFKNEAFLQISRLLSKFSERYRVQIKYEVDADYNAELERYNLETEKYAHHKWDKHVRNYIYEKLINKMQNREMRREQLYIYIAVKIDELIGKNYIIELEEDQKYLEKTAIDFFETEEYSIRTSLSCCRIHVLSKGELIKHIYTTLNKSAIDRNIDYEKIYNDSKSIIENCLDTEYYAETGEEGKKNACFYADGYYHNIFILDSLSDENTYPFYCNETLLKNELINYSITVNIARQNVEQTIIKKQRQRKTIISTLESEKDEIALEATKDDLYDQIYRLGKGEDIPFKIEYIIHIWDNDLKGLQRATKQLRNCADKMKIKLLLFSLGTQSLFNFKKTLPGCIYNSPWHNQLDANHYSLATMLPFSSTFTGLLDNAMAIFQGHKNNPVGLCSFYDGTPQHSLTVGQSGAGKSVNMFDMLSQMHCYYSKVVIIEEGLSYLTLTQIYSGQLLILDPQGHITINYFDTCGMPLTQDQLTFVIAILNVMAGETDDKERQIDRESLFMPYVNMLYEDKYHQWSEKNKSELRIVAREAITINYLQTLLPVERNTISDAYREIKDVLESRDLVEEYILNIQNYYNDISERQITDYIIENPELLKNIAFAHLKREDFPYHSQLIDYIRNSTLDIHDKTETDKLANRLDRYTITGPTGCMFDGYTNIDLSNHWIHIEIGKLANYAKSLRSITGLIIDNLIRLTVMSMNRNLKKVYIFEEAPRILAINGAEEIIKQSYAQFRKYNCVAETIIQAVEQMWETNLAKIILTQAKQLYLLKNKSIDDLRKIAEYAKIPEHTQRNIAELPSPEHQKGKEKYSAFYYYSDAGSDLPILGEVRNYASELILCASATKGNLYSEREEYIKQQKVLNSTLQCYDAIINFSEYQKNAELITLKKMLKELISYSLHKDDEELIRLSNQISKAVNNINYNGGKSE